LTALDDDSSSYSFSSGVVCNLRADRRIAHHGDVRNPTVANLVRHVVTTR
jgi:hypothetical protein